MDWATSAFNAIAVSWSLRRRLGSAVRLALCRQDAVASSLVFKHVFFVFAAGGLAALYVTRLRRPALYLIYPLALATLLPLRLIEHRYGLAAFVLLLVCREDDPPWVEAAGVGLSMLLSAVLLYGLARGLWML